MFLRSARVLVPTVLALLAAVPPSRAQPALSLEGALAAVDKQNATVLLGREALIQSEAAYLRERAGLLPQVTFDAQQRRTNSVSINSGVLSSTLGNRFDGNLNATLQVLTPSKIAAASAARAGMRVAELDLAATQQSAYAAVANAYFGHLRNLARFEVLESNIERARVLLDLAQRQLAAGVATQIDVTRAEAQLAVSEQARLQQQTALVQGELVFKRLLDLPLDQPLALELFKVSRQVGIGDGAFRAAEDFDRRADWRRALEAVKQGELAVRAADYQRLPSVRFAGQYGYASEQAFDSDHRAQWFASAALSFPVFDGRQIGANRQAARSLLRAQEIRQRDLRGQIGAEHRAAAQDAASRLAQIVVAEKNRDLAAEQLRLARLRYGQGVADNREVVEAQANLAQAADNLVEAIYRHQLSRVELARVNGDVRRVLQERE